MVSPEATDIFDTAPKNLAQIFGDAINRYGPAIAFSNSHGALSYDQVGQKSGAFANFLKARCKTAGGRCVALMVPNVLAFPITSVAVAWANCIQVNINPFYTERELKHQLQDSGATVLVVHESCLPTYKAIEDDVDVHTVVIVQDALDGEGATAHSQSNRLSKEGVTHFLLTDVLAQWPGSNSTAADVIGSNQKDDAIALIQYTGGTTGLSKGAVICNKNIAINSAQVKASLSPPLGDIDECVLTVLPLYHIFAFTVNFVTCFSIGARNILISDASNLDAIFNAASGQRITLMTGVNTLYAHIAAHARAQEIDWSNFKVAIGGGSAIMSSTSRRWKALTGRHILEGYGMTETSPVISTNSPGEAAFTGTVGAPLPLTEVAIYDDENRRLSLGEIGEICIKGPQVMQGYWQQPEATARVFNADGFLKSGDIGSIDEHGRIKIVDRKKDMILVSGFNVYPNEVEDVAGNFPNILECACVGAPSDTTGEMVLIYVVLDDASQPLDQKAFIAFCRESLVAYKVPKEVIVMTELPKSTVGKVLRRELRNSV